MTQIALNATSLQVQRGKRTVIDDVSFELTVGEVLGVLGPNGAGKSSLLGACCAELPIGRGNVALAGHSTQTMKALALARARAVLPQYAGMTFDLPVQDVVSMGAYPFAELTPQYVEESVVEAIEQADLSHKLHEPYSALSGGEQQRAQFARVLVQTKSIVQSQGHAFLFLDEPTASLDPKHQVLLMRVVRQLAREHQTGVMVVLHDLNMAAQWCDRLMLMANGQIKALDVPEKVLTEPLLEEVYGLPMLVRPHPKNAQQLIVMVDD
ncbi:heme ABC transporter ATP-binding protein [Orrella sp. 11846]|uniref:heme ABC transporter ATP-binding protein n=1 Tax=Orrella sp. 11846 TaxID=3409913 RepID=UPI003B5BD09E